MITDILTIILLTVGISGIINHNLNMIGIILSINIIVIAIFINLAVCGITQNNEAALTFAFFMVVASVLINAVVASIAYAYFDKKGTMEIGESIRDI